MTDEECRTALKRIAGYMCARKDLEALTHAMNVLEQKPTVIPQEPQSFKWCTDCKEYDIEKHCCHRYSKVIRDTVEEMKQEPILDKIRAEIAQLPTKKCTETHMVYIDAYNFKKDVLAIFDKYKADKEQEK